MLYTKDAIPPLVYCFIKTVSKLFFTIFLTLAFNICLIAQVPDLMSYQAVIRDNGNELVTNSQVSMRVSILQGSDDGAVVWSGQHSGQTNSNGLVSTVLGAADAIVLSGSFESIDWSAGPWFIKTETDITGGEDYSVTSVTPLLSVPFSLHSRSAEQITGPLHETDPVFGATFEIDDARDGDIIRYDAAAGRWMRIQPGFAEVDHDHDSEYSVTGHTHEVAISDAEGYMSASDRLKLDGIEEGAQVNVNADWEATEGASMILNKPTTQEGYGITIDGTVTSIGISGGETGLMFEGEPVTGEGELVMSGVLSVSSGGTGSADGSVTGTGSLDFTAGGEDHDITLTPGESGTINLSGLVRGVAGSASLPGYSFGSAPGSGIFLSEENETGVSTAGVERVRISSSGQIGMGTSEPAYTLDVDGDVNLSGELRIGGNNLDRVPAGVITIITGNETPTGYLLCRGQEVRRVDFPELFAVIGTTYGDGDGSTTFNLPDLQSRIPVGRSTEPEFAEPGQTGGSMTHTLTVDEMPLHSHNGSSEEAGGHVHTGSTDEVGGHTHTGTTQTSGEHSHDFTYHSVYIEDNRRGSGSTEMARWEGRGGNTDVAGGHSHTITTDSAGSHSHLYATNTTVGHSHNFNLSDTGGGMEHNNLQPYIVVNYVIKY